MIAILFVRSVTVAALCLSAAFFFSEFTIGPMWAIPMDIAPKFSDSASGLMNSGSALAAIVSPPIAGYVIDGTGTWELPSIGSLALLLNCSIAAFWMRPNEGLDSPLSTAARPAATTV
jgi:ACS family glucarate transporter-like MFS transporter